MLNRDSEFVICSKLVICELLSCDVNSTLGSVVPLAMFLKSVTYRPTLSKLKGGPVKKNTLYTGNTLKFVRAIFEFLSKPTSKRSQTNYRWSLNQLPSGAPSVALYCVSLFVDHQSQLLCNTIYGSSCYDRILKNRRYSCHASWELLTLKLHPVEHWPYLHVLLSCQSTRNVMRWW